MMCTDLSVNEEKLSDEVGEDCTENDINLPNDVVSPRYFSAVDCLSVDWQLGPKVFMGAKLRF